MQWGCSSKGLNVPGPEMTLPLDGLLKAFHTPCRESCGCNRGCRRPRQGHRLLEGDGFDAVPDAPLHERQAHVGHGDKTEDVRLLLREHLFATGAARGTPYLAARASERSWSLSQMARISKRLELALSPWR